MSTYRTRCLYKALMRRSGSSGLTGSASTTGRRRPRCSQEPREARDLAEPVFGREPEDAGHVVKDLSVKHGPRFDGQAQVEARGVDQAFQCPHPRIRLAALNPRNSALWRACSAGEFALRQGCARACVADQGVDDAPAGLFHDIQFYITSLLHATETRRRRLTRRTNGHGRKLANRVHVMALWNPVPPSSLRLTDSSGPAKLYGSPKPFRSTR